MSAQVSLTGLRGSSHFQTFGRGSLWTSCPICGCDTAAICQSSDEPSPRLLEESGPKHHAEIGC
jgi:hypothetical protein